MNFDDNSLSGWHNVNSKSDQQWTIESALTSSATINGLPLRDRTFNMINLPGETSLRVWGDLCVKNS